MVTDRPWGYYAILEERIKHKVKRIVVYEGQRLSLQSHSKRQETWVFIKGVGSVEVDGVKYLVQAGSIITIPLNAKHRVKNTGEEHLEFIEIQTGEYFGEDDIVRYSDDYGRV